MKPTLRLILSIFCFSLVFGLNAQTSSVTYSTPGSSTFTVPFGVTQITVEVWGAGGTGGSIDGNGSNYWLGAGGGGGGAYAKKAITVTPCSTYSYTVGAGASSSSAGGDSFFLSTGTVMAKGGLSAPGGQSSAGALGGSATLSIGDVTYSGGNGANGTSSSTYGVGGGSSAGSGSNGNSGSGSSGGAAPTGGGAGGNGKTGSDGSGSNGGSPGGGGGGALNSSNNILRSGGQGGDGQVKISWNTVQLVAPTLNNGTNATCNSFVANWTTTSYATTYRLDVSKDNFATFVSGYNNLDVGNVITSSVIGLTAGTTYYYRVRAVNSCGTTNTISNNSGTIMYTMQSVPATPGAITGTATQCPTLTGQVYSIAPVTNATTYTWSVPTGWSITSGNGTTSITVTTGATGQNGYISVTAGNNCGTSAARTLVVTISSGTPTTPGVVLGTTPQCPSLKGQMYSISAVPNATTYTWTVPVGWIINSDDGTTSITVTTGTSGGNITVTAGNSCGTSAPSTLSVSVNPSSIDFDGIDDYIDFGNVHNQTGVFSFEAWVLQETPTTTATIISKGDVKPGAGNQRGYHFFLSNGKLNLSWYDNAGATILSIESVSAITNNKKWHHVAATFNGTDAVLYLDGTEVKRGTPSSAPVAGTESFLIGAMYDSSAPANPKNYFDGFIDEVRVWNVALTLQQIREMMNQEIQMNGTAVKGKIIPKDISGGCLWTNLKGYYSMNDGTATDLSSNGINGIPKNICLSQAQTAPMPYMASATGGDWTSAGSWLHGNVWDIENIATNNDWNIIKLSSNVTASHNVKTYGLIIDSGVTFTLHNESLLENTRYLELNGTIDLKDDSQLVQTATSDLVTSATGKILRRQEGASSAFWYNYWASPVGTTGATSLIDNNAAATNNPNNTAFKLNMLKNESGINMQFTPAYNQVDKISTYWLYTFKNGLTYWDWALLSPTASLTPGIGYTQKGTGNAGLHQQYIFEGKPNNGTILVDVIDKGGNGSVPAVSKTEYLLGNPYPSALDIYKFIEDNASVIDGTLQLWQQWAGNSHYLDEYKGGYAQVNKLGTVRASQFVGLSGATTGGLEGTLLPTKFLPVGQGFIVEIKASGTVKFNNSQRVFIKESDANGTYNNGSVFLKSSSTKSKGTSTTDKQQTSGMKKIRLEFNSVVGPKTRRELLLGFSDMTTDGFDYGYDALCGDTSNNDFNLSLDGQSMNMQAYSSITSDKVVPLNFKSSANNTFEIKATEFENMDEIQNVYLRDNVTGTYFDLKQNAAYRFSSAQGKFNTRFEMVFQSKSEAESKLLGVEESNIDANFIYYQNTSKTIFGKKLNTSIDKLAIVNMNGQTVQEFSNVSQETLSNGIKLNNMASGTYVAWFKAQTGQVITKKIIVN